MLHTCINFHVSKELGVVRIEVGVDDKLVYCLVDILGVHNELLLAYHRSLRNATGKRDWSRAAAWSCESLCASSVIKTEPDTESFSEYLQKWFEGRLTIAILSIDRNVFRLVGCYGLVM